MAAPRRSPRAAPPPAVDPCPPGQLGGAYRPLSDADLERIHASALRLLAELGMGEVPEGLERRLLAAGAEKAGVAASMTDAKAIDAQYGVEKGISALAAGFAGGNLVYESSGMTASLLGASFEAFVLDDEMHSLIYRAMRGIEVNEETLGVEAIREAVLGEGHFLGGAHTMAAMERDYFYPRIADRDAPVTWEENGRPDARSRARERARAILDTHRPTYLDPEAEARIRGEFDILLEA